MKRFTVTVTIDRPMGYQDRYGNRYPIPYGFISGIIAGDGEYQDAYLLTKESVTKTFVGEVAAVILRQDDQEDKWVVVAPGDKITKAEIKAATDFIEGYFDSEIRLLEELK